MSRIELYHGSDHAIEKPDRYSGKKYNDYGQGFYCTEDLAMAGEWACKNNTDGIINKYTIDISNLNILNLFDEKYNILHWMALLLQNRTFHVSDGLETDARDYIVKEFAIDIGSYDIIKGYRADDSYFAFAEAFIQNRLPLRSLNIALRLGKLGEQIMIRSDKAFSSLQYEGAEVAAKSTYYSRFEERDINARETYRNQIKGSKAYKEDIFVLDILREEVKGDDPRIQRIVSE